MSNTQTKNVPELRFPGFEGEWEEKKLGEFCEFNNGINAKKEQYGMGRKFINVLDILNNNFITYESVIGKVSVPENVEKNNKVEFGDLVFLRSSETREDVGLCNVYLDKNYALYGGFIIRGKKVSDYNPIFLKEVLNIPKKRYEIGSAAGGSTRFNVSQDILRKINVKFPSIKEQQKIGDLFSKLDRQIELEEQKLELLQQKKKGYMQKIFSQELRFKDENGDDYPNWVIKLLGDIGKVAMNKRIYKHETSTNEEIPFYKIGNFGKKADTFISREQFNEYKEKYPYPKKGDILISASGSIGKTIEYNGEEAYYQDSNIVWLDHNEEVLNVFLKYFYILVKWSGIEGTTIKRLYNKNILNTKIDLPTISEQQKIGDFFAIIDNLIEIQERKLEFLKQRKQSLLQKMFV
ncbi:restriction endonuclease subunit S [Staphylococcus aureus]|uniref:restriction endonuclease subunit S n=1 Tax=Staphylococcus aureus TaxID=1280 RepID=UPI00215D37D4|nr:restriction endonuclease subunit S [Staphylococcus aureus]UVJ04581.1 restriction endonuclease subunit S [Staphylococcus aureus]UVJ25272.1 restriction endonuclease subunit S [Staphylococcus aureus]